MLARSMPPATSSEPYVSRRSWKRSGSTPAASRARSKLELSGYRPGWPTESPQRSMSGAAPPQVSRCWALGAESRQRAGRGLSGELLPHGLPPPPAGGILLGRLLRTGWSGRDARGEMRCACSDGACCDGRGVAGAGLAGLRAAGQLHRGPGLLRRGDDLPDVVPLADVTDGHDRLGRSDRHVACADHSVWLRAFDQRLAHLCRGGLLLGQCLGHVPVQRRSLELQRGLQRPDRRRAAGRLRGRAPVGVDQRPQLQRNGCDPGR
jgi:hypothetical protein